MTQLQDQLTRMVKFSAFLREGLKENEERDLAEIDRSLDIAVDNKLDESINSIMGEGCASKK